MNAILHKKAAWVYAAQGVIQYGLPKLQPCPPWRDNATEHINAVGTFVRDLAKWLQCFADGLVTYRNTDTYKKAREASGTPIETWGLTSSPENKRRYRAASAHSAADAHRIRW